MKIIKIILNTEDQGLANSLINGNHDYIIDNWQYYAGERVVFKIIVSEINSQKLTDSITKLISKTDNARIIISPIDYSYPESETNQISTKTSHNDLLKEATANGSLNLIFISMVVLSTIVAGIGMLENNIAVIIGAMVIAPLLGPNLSLSIGTTFADYKLIASSLVTLITGLSISIIMSYTLGLWWDEPLTQTEILSRTEPSYSAIILALVSGAAAVLSLTTRVSSSLVGVMVAVAILPPASVLGVMLGTGELVLAKGAALLLGINLCSINLSANLVMIVRNIFPRSPKDKTKAKISIILSSLIWITLLSIAAYYV